MAHAIYLDTIRFKTFLIFTCLVNFAAAADWSNWLPCNATNNCFFRNILTCSQGQGINCADLSINSKYELIALKGCDWDCILNDTKWILTTVRTDMRHRYCKMVMGSGKNKHQ